MINKKIIMTKAFLKPNESIDKISNKYEIIKNLSIQVDWSDPKFEKLWDDRYLNKIASHESTSKFLEIDPSLVIKNLKVVQKLKLNDSELENFQNNFNIFKYSSEDSIIERINLLRKTQLEETLTPLEISGFHQQYYHHRRVVNSIKKYTVDENTVDSIGTNGIYKINTPPNLFQEPNILMEPRKFMISDLTNLKINLLDNSGNTRANFLKSIDEDGFARVHEICNVINEFGIHSEIKNDAVNNMFTKIGQQFLQNGTCSDSTLYMENMQNHPDIEEIVEKLSSMFIHVPLDLLERFNILFHQHEFFTLCTIEPYMISVIGNGLFFKILLPPSQTGSIYIIDGASYG